MKRVNRSNGANLMFHIHAQYLLMYLTYRSNRLPKPIGYPNIDLLSILMSKFWNLMNWKTVIQNEFLNVISPKSVLFITERFNVFTCILTKWMRFDWWHLFLASVIFLLMVRIRLQCVFLSIYLYVLYIWHEKRHCRVHPKIHKWYQKKFYRNVIFKAKTVILERWSVGTVFLYYIRYTKGFRKKHFIANSPKYSVIIEKCKISYWHKKRNA